MQYTNIQWRDGQPYSEMFDDIYYSSNESESNSGEKEFEHVFFKHNGLPARWFERDKFVIAELGFGSGLNCMLTIRQWLNYLAISKTEKCLHYIAIEKYPLSPQSIRQIISRYPELNEICEQVLDNYPPAIATTHKRQLFDNRVVIHYKFMDVNEALKNEHFNVDAWYLDGFAPAKNADMWSQELFMQLAQNSRAGTTCSSYTSAGFVRRNLQQAGFVVHKTSGFGKKREMLVARFDKSDEVSNKYADRPWFISPPEPVFSEKKATIVGAGIAGLSVAYALIRRGWSVTMIDRQGAVARETSSNPAAIVYPRLSVNNELDTEFYTAAYCCSLHELQSLQKKHQKKFWFDSGLLQLMDRKKISQIIDRFQFNDEYVAIADDLKEEAVSTLSGKEMKQQVYVNYKTAGVVLPVVLCEVLRDECGARLNIISAEIDELKSKGTLWQCLSSGELISESEILVMASGAADSGLVTDLNFPVAAVRGQVVALRKNARSEKIKQALNSGFYLTPVINNKHYLGASYSRQNSSLLVDAEDSRALFESLNDTFPGVFHQDDLCGAWVGLRAMSKDRVPVVGAVADRKYFYEEYADICHGKVNKDYQPARYLNGLYISAAHGSRGFCSSFISAEIIASQIAAEPLPVSKSVLDFINPSRFSVDDLKRR